MCVGPADGVNLLDIRMIHGEFKHQTVRIGEVQRPAVSVVGDHHHFVSSVLRPRANRLLLFGGDEHREMPEERERRWRCELLGELGVGELKKRKAPPVTELVHRVAELLFLAAHQVLDFRPCSHERHADNVLVEPPGGLLIGGHKSVVVKSRWGSEIWAEGGRAGQRDLLLLDGDGAFSSWHVSNSISQRFAESEQPVLKSRRCGATTVDAADLEVNYGNLESSC